MAKFERVNFLRANLSREEVHLHSFHGFLCAWDQGRFAGKETPILIEDAALLGHVTNTRFIIEPRKVKSLSMVLGALGPEFLERIVSGMVLPGGLFDTARGGKETMYHMADQIGYLSFNFADMDHLGVYNDFACWPVMKYNMNGRDPAFLPYSLYRITAYTGVLVGPPAPGEFAEVIRNRGVRIVTYTSKGVLII
jgi:hypothetical protein